MVIVGLGWTGSILGMELAQDGLEIVALERGHDQNTVPDFQYPEMIDELKYGVRLGMMQKPRNSTVTIVGARQRWHCHIAALAPSFRVSASAGRNALERA